MYWNPNYPYYWENNINKMFPKMYYELYPYIMQACNKSYRSYPYSAGNFTRKKDIDDMVDEVYQAYKKDNKLFEQDSENLYRHHHGDDIFKDIIKILILKELLDGRRRRPPCYPPRCRRPYDYY